MLIESSWNRIIQFRDLFHDLGCGGWCQRLDKYGSLLIRNNGEKAL